MERVSTGSTRAALAACLAVLVWCLWRAATLPVTAAEARLYDHLVRLPAREALWQPDAWKGLLYAIAARRTVNLLRLSEFTLRLPCVLAAALYLWSAYRLAEKKLWFLVLALYPALSTVFVIAGGRGVASALCLLALRTRNGNLAGLYLGLALAVAPEWFWLPAAVALAMLFLYRGGIRWLQEVGITATATAFILLLIPLVHAGDSGELPGASPELVRMAATTLRADAGSRPVRIGVSREVRDQLTFYQAKYRARSWKLVPAGSGPADYYLVNTPAGHTGRVLFDQGDLLLLAPVR